MGQIEHFNPEVHTDSDRISDLFRVWDEIRGDRTMPSRRDFNPMAVPALLPYIFMDDVFRDPIRFRFRLVGTEIVRGIGFDPTGRPESPHRTGRASTTRQRKSAASSF